MFQAPELYKNAYKSFQLLNVFNRKVTFSGFDAFQTSEPGYSQFHGGTKALAPRVLVTVCVSCPDAATQSAVLQQELKKAMLSCSFLFVFACTGVYIYSIAACTRHSSIRCVYFQPSGWQLSICDTAVLEPINSWVFSSTKTTLKLAFLFINKGCFQFPTRPSSFRILSCDGLWEANHSLLVGSRRLRRKPVKYSCECQFL